ncbi:MAG: thioredoxin [Myxococcaceae bacterium]|nr:thioredoxin [Myxococcaceae bacterium]
MSSLESLSLEAFPTVTGTGRVLVDFGADWCAPCRTLAPTFEKAAQQYGEKLTFAKVDIDEEPELAQSLHIHSIPTLIAFENGQEVGRLSGALPAQLLRVAIDRFLDGRGFGQAHAHHTHAHP